ncbi:MAG: nucleotidyl transferase AbiEii/AbiGii toxin family protein [bacterium]
MDMNKTLESFKKVLKALHEYEVEYVLIGGFAVALQGVERFTKDLDIFIRNEPANIRKLKQALHSVFNDSAIEEIDEHETCPVVRYGTPDDYYIDILSGIGEAFTFDDLEYEVIRREGIDIRIATIETMIKLKESTIRLQDKADALDLKRLLEKRKRK